MKRVEHLGLGFTRQENEAVRQLAEMGGESLSVVVRRLIREARRGEPWMAIRQTAGDTLSEAQP